MGVGNFGSPPRGRGKAGLGHGNVAAVGITPAWAGKSFTDGNDLTCAMDYPRVGGEKIKIWVVVPTPKGSPPRRRGKVFPFFEPIDKLGITPAWAGKRRISTMTACITRDHPRRGGEK